MTTLSWKQIRAEAEGVRDVRGEVTRLGNWTMEQAEEAATRLQESCELPDDVSAFRALLEILLMRERLEVSETLSPDMQLRLVEIMWLRLWTIDETRKALSEVFDRFCLRPRTIARGIEVLASIGHCYRRMKQPDRWPNRAARSGCAEMMWLSGLSEDQVFEAARDAMQRFEYGRGEEEKALRALQGIELVFRDTAFDNMLGERDQRLLAEVMWLRGWTLQKALAEAVAIRNALGLEGTGAPIRALNEICLRCGGPVTPNPVSQAIDTLVAGTKLTPEEQDGLLTRFGKFRWIRQYTAGQALEKVRRYANMTDTPLLEVFDASLEAAEKSYRERKAEEDAEKAEKKEKP